MRFTNHIRLEGQVTLVALDTDRACRAGFASSSMVVSMHSLYICSQSMLGFCVCGCVCGCGCGCGCVCVGKSALYTHAKIHMRLTQSILTHSLGVSVLGTSL